MCCLQPEATRTQAPRSSVRSFMFTFYGTARGQGWSVPSGILVRRDRYANRGRSPAAKWVRSVRSDLVNAFHAVDAGNFANVGEDGFELAAVRNFEAGVDARVQAVGPAFQAGGVGG